MFMRFLIVMSIAVLSGCANFNTIGRSSSLGGGGNTQNVAIHLDAQQRVVLSKDNMKKICAEPSPDALAAHAAAAALGVNVLGQGSGSGALSGQSPAASIGLRTQSITLMRDALYRVCEASMNEEIGPVQVATLLGRGMDLTAVVLAVEQLTGAVAANQANLTGATTSSAAASLVSNQKLLDAAREDETQKRAALEAAQKELDKSKADVVSQEADLKTKKTAHENAQKSDSGVTQEEKNRLETEFNASNDELNRRKTIQQQNEEQVKIKQTSLDDAVKIKQTIENLRDSAHSSAVANTSSQGEFSTPIQAKILSGDATKEIAKSVEAMVSTVLNKRYTEESCTAYLALKDSSGKYINTELVDACITLITAKVKTEAEAAKADAEKAKADAARAKADAAKVGK